MLRITSVFARWAILVADREGDIERDAELMRREGILSEDTCVLWEHSFEEDNFTDNELVAILADLASEAAFRSTWTARGSDRHTTSTAHTSARKRRER